MAPEPTIRGARRAHRPHPARRRWRLALVIGSVLLIAGASAFGAATPPGAADAVVAPASGFRATVLGWSSWYGSYQMGSLGSAWCIDHGLHAPDPAFRYVPTAAPDLDADTAAAISWIVTAHGGDRDAVAAAAVMLVLHDLRHASYPFGVLDVDRLAPHDLAGFGGHEAEVIDRARAIKVEARSHRSLRAPFHLALTPVPRGEPAGAGTGAGTGAGPIRSARDVDGEVTTTLTDAAGRPVAGAGIALEARGASLVGAASGASGADGSFRATYRLDPGPLGAAATFVAHAIVPAPVPATFASSTVRAQRVVRGAWLGLDATATSRPTPTTSTSSTTTSTTSTSTSTTSTTAPRPRPTFPPTSTSTTVHPRPPASAAPPTTSAPTTSMPATTASSEAPPPSTVHPPPTGGTLPRTGSRTLGWALIGAGLVLLGATLVALSRGWAG